MARLTLVRRLILLAVVTLIAAWTVTAALFYMRADPAGASLRPAPERIAAIARLVDGLAPSDRALALDAIATPALRPRILGALDADMPADAREPETDLSDSYARTLAGRPFRLVATTRGLIRRYPALTYPRREALQFRIGLADGSALLIETTGAAAFSPLGLPLGVTTGLIGSLIAVGAVLVMLKEIRPLLRLAEAVDRIDLSDADAVLPDVRRSAPEIRSLVAAFERLQRRLSGLLAARMAMLAGISHDVRTFATRLRLKVEAIPDPAERERAVADIAT
ncbi:hypothetical protein [Methylobrevis pamukkalensis]|uniref:histidine kinase n=1 Tax=Methylobrevis pamukkalensis TaxID=1439726 RepID=A0A1E3H6M9_9HYPH|nr:hypothetical protein [Methylobrevis pamukkalensis]ODN71980.1 osmolarity sensor protein [Methylobrevis pamukkalensis]